MLPVIAIVGRPNVGKSTLFNRITRTRDALVFNEPGVTRDRLYGEAVYNERKFIVIDTGGLAVHEETIDELMAGQAWLAVKECDLVLFVVDAKEGLVAGDEFIIEQLRKLKKVVQLVVNKTDGIEENIACSDFFCFGFHPIPIAASHNRGINGLLEVSLDLLDKNFPKKFVVQDEDAAAKEFGIKIAIVGRPNVGKSTLTNRLLGEDRVVVCDMPGTTRDSIYIPLERRGKKYTIIDTAGVRRRAKIGLSLEKFSVVKTLQAVEDSNVVVVLIDAKEGGVAEQDLKLMGFILNAGKAMVIAVNKWDGLDSDKRDRVKNELNRRLGFLDDFVDVHFISALHGTGVGHIYDSVHSAYSSAMKQLSTPMLTKALEQAVIDHNPPLAGGRRIKLRYAHSGGHNPPIIVIHGNMVDRLNGAYKQYLKNYFRKSFKLVGTPIKLVFKKSQNPYTK